MSNKTQLQENNTKLNTILSNALGLPTQESMKNGKYVWKKSKRGIDSVEVKGSYTTKIVPYGFLINTGKALFDSNKKYIGKPNDSNFPIGIEGVYILASLTNNTGGIIEGEAIYYISSIFQGSAYNVEMYNDYKINYTETFISYVVSDNPNEYPDKAVHSDGFYYEKVVGLDLLLKITGSNKIAVDKFVKASDTTINNQVKHSLGTIPKYAIINTAEWEKLTYSGSGGGIKYGFITCFGTNSDKRAMYGHNYEGQGGSSSNYSNYITVNDAYVILDKGTYYDYYQSGIEYTIITMA